MKYLHKFFNFNPLSISVLEPQRFSHGFGFVFLLLFVFLGAPSFARAGDDTEEILIKYFDITDGQLAFSFQKDSKKEIRILDFATLAITPLFRSSGNEEAPRFSPDKTKLLFQSDRTGEMQVYVGNSDGTNVKQLTNGPGKNLDPDWSPDSKKVVFQSSKISPGTNIFIMNSDGSGAEAITKSDKTNFAPRWAPDGKSILFSTTQYWPGWDLLLYDMQTKKVAILTSGYESAFRAAFDPSGKSYAFCYGAGDDTDIWLQKNGEPKGSALVTRPVKDFDPEWMDDGKHLFFVSETAEKSNHFEIFLLDVTTQQTTQVTESKGSIRDLTWRPHSPTSLLIQKQNTDPSNTDPSNTNPSKTVPSNAAPKPAESATQAKGSTTPSAPNLENSSSGGANSLTGVR